MAKTLRTAPAPNGEVFTRRTDRTYTHALALFYTYSDGTTACTKPNWAGRPDLAQKGLAKLQAEAAAEVGTEVRRWTMEGGWQGTGIFRTAVQALALPVEG